MRRLALLLLLAFPRLVLATCTQTDAYSTLICSLSPLHYYRFDATSGTSETDLGSLADNGTYSGTFTLQVAGIPSVTDKAVSYGGGGTGKLIESSSNADTRGPSTSNGVGWTFLTWIHTTGGFGTAKTFGNRYSAGGCYQWIFNTQTSPAGQLTLTYYNNTCAGLSANTLTGANLANDTTYLVGFSSLGNGTNIDTELCLNGASQATQSNKPIFANASTTTATSWGRDGDATYQSNLAFIDEGATFPSKLACATTQASIYNCGHVGACAGGAYTDGLYMSGKLEFGPKIPKPLDEGLKKLKAYWERPVHGVIVPSIFHP